MGKFSLYGKPKGFAEVINKNGEALRSSCVTYADLELLGSSISASAS